MNTKELREFFEQERDKLRAGTAYFSGSDLYVNLKANIAVIGIQTSFGSSGHDYVYVVRKKGNKAHIETILDVYSVRGRMFPTGISKDGTKFFYTVKDENGFFHKKEKSI